jgi:tetratricopeptide (TPR) repeat protein
MAQGPGKTQFMEAQNLVKANRYPEAIAKFDEAIKLEPSNYKYLFARGKCYFKMKDTNLAIASLEDAVNAKADYTPALSLLAKAYEKNGDVDQAVHYYNSAFKYETDNSRKVAYKMAAVGLLLKAGRNDEAREHIREAKAVDPENPNLLYYDAKFANQGGDYETARDNMVALTSKMQGQPIASVAKYYYELGVAYNGLGDYQNANKAWEQAYFGEYKKLIDRERSKNSPAFYYRMAVSYYMTGNYEEAEGQIKKSLELQNNFASAYSLRGKIAKKQGNYTQAISAFSSAADYEADPKKKASLLNQLANLQVDAGDFSGALSTINQLIGTAPSPNLVYNKALAQYNLGQYSGAISTLEEGLAIPNLDPNNKAKFNLLLGMAAKNTDKERAIEAFRAASFGPFKPAAKNELDALNGKAGG